MFPSAPEPRPAAPGHARQAGVVNWLARAVSAFGRIRSTAGMPGMDAPAGPMFRMGGGGSAVPTFIGKLTGAGSPYDLQEYRGDPASPATLISYPGGVSCTACAVEVNGVAGLGGLFTEALWPSNDGIHYFFVWKKMGCTHKLRIHIYHDDRTAFSGVPITITHGTAPVVTDYSGTTDASGNIPDFAWADGTTYTITITIATSWGTCTRSYDVAWNSTVPGGNTLGCYQDMSFYVCTGKICLALTDCTTGAAVTGATIQTFTGALPALLPEGCAFEFGYGYGISDVVESPAGTYCAQYCHIQADIPPCQTPLPRAISWTATKAGYQDACGTGSFDCVHDVNLTGSMMDLAAETAYVPGLAVNDSGACCLGCGTPGCPTCDDPFDPGYLPTCAGWRSDMILRTLHVTPTFRSWTGGGCDPCGPSGWTPGTPIAVVWDGVKPGDPGWTGQWHWASTCLPVGTFDCCSNAVTGFVTSTQNLYGQLHLYYGNGGTGGSMGDSCCICGYWVTHCGADCIDDSNCCPTYYGNLTHACCPLGTGKSWGCCAPCGSSDGCTSSGTLCGPTPSYALYCSYGRLDITA